MNDLLVIFLGCLFLFITPFLLKWLNKDIARLEKIIFGQEHSLWILEELTNQINAHCLICGIEIDAEEEVGFCKDCLCWVVENQNE